MLSRDLDSFSKLVCLFFCFPEDRDNKACERRVNSLVESRESAVSVSLEAISYVIEPLAFPSLARYNQAKNPCKVDWTSPVASMIVGESNAFLITFKDSSILPWLAYALATTSQCSAADSSFVSKAQSSLESSGRSLTVSMTTSSPSSFKGMVIFFETNDSLCFSSRVLK